MIHYNIYFRPYDWQIEIYIILKNLCIDTLLDSLKDCSLSEIQKIIHNITTRVDSGFIRTFDNKSTIVINQPSSLEEFVNIYNHEKNHLEMHICSKYGIDPHSEEASELSGRLAKCLFGSLLDLLLIYYSKLSSN